MYVQDSISQVLDKNDINCYKVPENPFVLQSFDNHFYGKKVSPEVNLLIEKDNSVLAKEIEDQAN